MDSIFVIPEYGINLIQHVVCLWLLTLILPWIQSRTKTLLPKFKKEPEVVAEPKVVAPLKPLPPPTPTVEEVKEEEEEQKVENETPVFKVEIKEPSPEDEKDWIYFLTNIQEEMAELQLKRIPLVFSQDSYQRAQDRITNFQMEKFMGGYEKKKDEKGNKQ